MSRKPNILFIMADQLTFELMGAYDHSTVFSSEIPIVL